MNEIQIKKVTYQGGFITEESLEKLLAAMKEKELKLLPREVKDRHVTINFFDDKVIKVKSGLIESITINKEKKSVEEIDW